MKTLSTLAALAAFTLPASAQVLEIPAMTVSDSVVDLDATSLGAIGAAGPVTVAALRAAGTNGGAPIAAITLTASTAPQGFYNTNVPLTFFLLPPNQQQGRALGFDAVNNRLVLVNPFTFFTAFNARIDLQVPATEFGISIGDWLEGMVLDFYFQGVQVGTIVSSNYDTEDAKFFQSPAVFDQVNVRATSTSANWVIPELHIQNVSRWSSFGSGCPGSNGVPQIALNSPANIGTTFRLNLSNLPTAGGVFAMALGFSNISSSFGPLPFNLAPLGAPDCFMLCDTPSIVFGTNTAGAGLYTLAIPNAPAYSGIVFFNQAYVLDLPANALGVTSSNGGRAVVL